MRDPLLAGILSFLLPGVGQIYNGRVLIGITLTRKIIQCAVISQIEKIFQNDPSVRMLRIEKLRMKLHPKQGARDVLHSLNW